MRRGLAVAALLLLPSAALAVGVRAQTASCPALAYVAALGQARDALQGTPPDVDAARGTVVALLAADGNRSSALSPIVADLSGTAPALDDARARLSSMAATLAYPSGSTCEQGSRAALNTLHGVYAEPAFRHLDEVGQTSLLTTILNALSAVIGGVNGALGRGGEVVLGAVVLALIGLLVWRRYRAASATRDAHHRGDEPATLGDDPDAEWRAAQRAAASGEFREAVRRAFRSAVLEVALRGGIHVDAAWTTRELLQRCSGDADVLAALVGAAAVFQRAWYSGRPVTGDDWQLAADRCTTVRRLATRVHPAAL